MNLEKFLLQAVEAINATGGLPSEVRINKGMHPLLAQKRDGDIAMAVLSVQVIIDSNVPLNKVYFNRGNDVTQEIDYPAATAASENLNANLPTVEQYGSTNPKTLAQNDPSITWMRGRG
jgi:dethiobiotin synthetase